MKSYFIINGNVYKNMIVDTGREAIARRLCQDGSNVFKYIALGTSSTPVDSTDTTLGNEIIRQEASFLWNGDDYYWVLTSTFESGAGTITEAGIFNDISNGTMLARCVFNPIIKESGQILIVNWRCYI